MLIYERDGARLHAAELSLPHPTAGSRGEAEARAVAELLREALPGREAALRHRESGAPYLEGDDMPEISISHCRRMALIALAPKGSRIGVDCESADRAEQLRRVAARFLAAEEIERWSATEERLFQAWTIKEAAFKAAGNPSLTMRALPLPATAPGENGAADSEVAIGGRRYGVWNIASPVEGVMITLVRGI